MTFVLRNGGSVGPMLGEHAGQYLRTYHDTTDGRGAFTFTPDPREAKQFETMEAALEFWRHQSITRPIRADGKPNRPMTIFHCMVETLEAAMEAKPALVLDGGTLSDQVFELETDDEGTIAWNVTRMEQAAKAGQFGPARVFATRLLPPSKYENVSRAKIEAIKTQPDILDKPIIGIGRKTKLGDPAFIRCIADGNHRLIARIELDLPDFAIWIVPPERERDYRVDIRIVKP